ncbi:phage tail spike protein [Terrisporobacter mayombei]|uniref:Tail spike domain-containing protein n=1 Tax=Terrisporobacter mayombei TaxID=1541 RepID=A0ABY9PYD1_9FIRM|nr:phage tail spike protein [Terrisporobacter mayombei]MCC3868516.1 phage tail protein [Terrisporobacter mayombei]WMT80672.1 hypothetical protein TEMA_09930 [Terrisporobacter mayombei]
MELLVLDSSFKIINTIYVDGGKSPIFDDHFKMFLNNGSSIYDFKQILDDDLSNDLEEGHYILFKYNGKNQLLQIKKCKDIEGIDNITRECECESMSLELYNSHVRPTTIEGTVKQAVTYTLRETIWKLGYVSETLSARVGALQVDKVTPVYSVLQQLIPEYGNIEYEFRVEVVNSITGKYNLFVDVYADGERGQKTYKRFEYDWNIEGCSRTGDITDYVTGMIGEGANGLTMANTRWSKSLGDPCDKPTGQDFLVDPEAQALLPTDRPILGVYTSTTTSIEQLMLETWRALQERKLKKFSYEIPIKMTSDEYNEIGIGDTVHVVNPKFNPPIQLEARIGELEVSFSDPTDNKALFTNYKGVKSKIRSVDSNTFVQDAIDAITGHIGKLTQADVARIQEYLSNLGMTDAEITKLLKKYKDKLPTKVEDNPDLVGDEVKDQENYRAINIGGKIDNGLWLGDDRLQKVKESKSHIIESIKTSTPNNPTSSASATEYKNALAYYEKFRIGKYGAGTSMTNLKSKSNPYKYYVLVPYWAKKFGLDPELVYAMIYAESSGHPYCSVGSSAGYGCMQCERSVYFGKKATITYYDGSKTTFTPSNSTMNPSNGAKTTISGVSVNKNISNQIMFGCHEMRKSLKYFKWNIFASLCGYNFGLYGTDWTICKYVADKNKLAFKNSNGYTVQSTKVQSLYFKELEGLKCNWSTYRKIYKQQKGGGTPDNIERYLQYYKVVNGQLPYVLVDGKKKGYGANKPSNVTIEENVTIKTGIASSARNKIVSKAREIVDLHVKYKKATYHQKPRTIDDTKRIKWNGRLNGLMNPAVYDCSSLVSCSYKHAGLTSTYNKSCYAGNLVSSTTSKSGFKVWKCTKTNLDNHAIAGDIIVASNTSVPSIVDIDKYKGVKKTHHTLIYCGKVNGKHMVAHARGNKPHPDAIMYMSVYDDLYTYGMIIRPWDLAKLDAEAGIKKDPITQKVETNEITLKSSYNTNPQEFYDDRNLLKDIFGNTEDIKDSTPYPSTVSHVFLDFCNMTDFMESDVDVDTYKGLIKLLLTKYPKKPIFFTKIPHVNNQMSNYVQVNAKIDEFNSQMWEYSAVTQYVIQTGIPSGIYDSVNKWISTSLTTCGWKLKDKASADLYYKAYKNHLIWLGGGGEYVREFTKASVILHTNFNHLYTKPMAELKWTMPSKPDISYYSKLTFTTRKSSEPTKMTQPTNIWLDGKDCKKGKLILKPDTTYTIVVYYNTDKEIANTTYLGSVSGVAKGGKYAAFDKFKDRAVIVNNALSFFNNKSKLVYNNTTPADYAKPQDNKSSWITGGKMHVDDSSLLNYVLMGWKYEKTPYGDANKNDNKKNSAYSWALPSTRHEANIAKYFVEQGWVFDEADLTTYTNLSEGDIIFMDADSSNNGMFMGCSHTAIVIGKDSAGDWEAVDSNPTDVIYKTKVKNLSKKNILFIGRIRKD